MKKKLLNFYNNISYTLIFFLIIFSTFSLIFILYRIGLKKDFSFAYSGINNNYFSKLKIYHDYKFFQKQKKYTEGHIIIPINFPSHFDKNEKNKKITRNGLLYLNKDAKATILVCHGFMSSKEDVTFLRYIFKDYNVLTFDFRAHGECTEHEFCTFGQEEKNDVIGAVEYIKKHPALKNKDIFVYGFSMGAVASILASYEKPNLFSGAIWDCPFDSTNGLINRALTKMKISLFGYNFTLPGSFLLKKYVYHPYIQHLLKFMLRSLAHMDATKINTVIKPVSPAEAIKNIKIPFLLISCHNDDKAPPVAVKNIYNNAKNSVFKRLWISSGRRHFDSFFSNPEKYIYKVRNFIKLIITKEYLNKKKEKIKEDPCIYCYL